MAFRLHRTPWVTGEGTGIAGGLADSGRRGEFRLKAWYGENNSVQAGGNDPGP
jgi:hypothetical protein